MTEAEREELRTAARIHLSDHVFAAVKAAMDTFAHPQLIMSAAPMVMAGIAGSYVLQFQRARILGDGEVDGVLDMLCDSLREHADPSKNTGEAIQLTDEARRFLRELFGRG